MSPPKRAKGKNFQPEETRLLINCIDKFKDVVENKKTDGTTVDLKNVAWKKLTDNFNSTPLEDQLQPREIRTCAQLRSFYENYKRKVRKDNADDKGELYKTGGGNFVKKLDEDGERLIGMLRPQFEPDRNQFDSATKYHDKTVDPEKSVNLISDTNEIDDNFDDDENKMIYSPISSPARVSTSDETNRYIESQYSVESPAATESVQAEEKQKSVYATILKDPLQAGKRPRSLGPSAGTSSENFRVKTNPNNSKIQHMQSVEERGGNKRRHDTSKLDLLEIEKQNKQDMARDMGKRNSELHELQVEKLSLEIERLKQSKKHEQELNVLEKKKIKLEIQVLEFKLKSQLDGRQ